MIADKQIIIDRVVFSPQKESDERRQLEYWIDNYGVWRYRDLLKAAKKEKIDYVELKELAKYDFNLSEFLFGVIRHFEVMLNAHISNLYSNKRISCGNPEELRNGLAEFLSISRDSLSKLDTDRKWKSGKKKTLYQILGENSLGFTTIIYSALPEDKRTIAITEEELRQLVSLRNLVYHKGLLVGKKDVADGVRLLYRCMPEGTLKDNFKRKWDKLNGNDSENGPGFETVRKFTFEL